MTEPDRDLRRALRFIVPYWRRLALVLALSVASTALTLYLPLLSRDFFDRALIGKDVATLVRVVLLFTLVSAPFLMLGGAAIGALTANKSAP